MRGLGTIINVAAVLAGSGIGLAVKNGLPERFQSILMQACGIAAVFIGAGGALSGLLQVNAQSALETRGTMLLVLSLVLGGLLGELLRIEERMDRLGDWLRGRMKAGAENRFVEGFVSSTLVICVGAMAVVGSIQDGMTGDYSMLAAKSILDFIIVMIFASTLGLGVIFSALPLGIYQGGITLLAFIASARVDAALVSDLSCIGSVLIFCVGWNLAFGKKLKVGNLLPAVLIPVLFHFFSATH